MACNLRLFLTIVGSCAGRPETLSYLLLLHKIQSRPKKPKMPKEKETLLICNKSVWYCTVSSIFPKKNQEFIS